MNSFKIQFIAPWHVNEQGKIVFAKHRIRAWRKNLKATAHWYGMHNFRFYR